MELLPTSDLNNPDTFPSYSDLPKEYEINNTYFSSTKPRRHWCFLGKVVSSAVFVRLSLQVEDKEGHIMPVAFHTDDRGAAFQKSCTPGSTIAVQYATQFTFPFDPPGLKLEESAHIKVFPYPLEEMLRTSKTIFERAKVAKCGGCGKVDASMAKCSRCKTVWYCSKTCQTKGWATHKTECAIFRDVQWFVSRNWETGTHTHAYPQERVPWNVSGYH